MSGPGTEPAAHKVFPWASVLHYHGEGLRASSLVLNWQQVTCGGLHMTGHVTAGEIIAVGQRKICRTCSALQRGRKHWLKLSWAIGSTCVAWKAF